MPSAAGPPIAGASDLVDLVGPGSWCSMRHLGGDGRPSFGARVPSGRRDGWYGLKIGVGALRRAYGSYRGASCTTRAFIAARLAVAPFGPLSQDARPLQ